MPRKSKKPLGPEHPIEVELKKPQTVGSLEILAGIDRSPAGRLAFWLKFKDIQPSRACIEAGCAELRRLARERAGLPPE